MSRSIVSSSAFHYEPKNHIADAGISIFAISTYDTDYLLVKSVMLNEAVSILHRYYPIDP